MTPTLTRLDAPPPGLFDLPASALEAALGGPTLIRIEGDRVPALFVSVLLHGNETSGWEAVRRVLGSADRPRRSIELFIGNVAAAHRELRSLPGQTDYNRIWKDHRGPEAALAEALLSTLAGGELFAAVDFHNNTGQNPHYAVLTALSATHRGLAWLFSDTAVFIEEPDTVLSRALEAFCPSIAVEVGPIRNPRSDDRATSLLTTLLGLDALPVDPGSALSLFRAVARVHVEPDVRFEFADSPTPAAAVDLVLTGGLESINFHAVEAGFELARTTLAGGAGLQVLDPSHRNVTDHWLERDDGVIRLRRGTVPAMVTMDPIVIRQDCLCYLMARL